MRCTGCLLMWSIASAPADHSISRLRRRLTDSDLAGAASATTLPRSPTIMAGPCQRERAGRDSNGARVQGSGRWAQIDEQPISRFGHVTRNTAYTRSACVLVCPDRRETATMPMTRKSLARGGSSVAQPNEPQQVLATLQFNEEVTLAGASAILSDLQEAYTACLTVAAWPDLVHPAEHAVSVRLRTGSLLVELISAVQPPMYVGTTILLLKTLITEGPALLALPQAIQAKWHEEGTKAELERAKHHAARLRSHSVRVIEPPTRRPPKPGDDGAGGPSGIFVVPEPPTVWPSANVGEVIQMVDMYVEWMAEAMTALMMSKSNLEQAAVGFAGFTEGTSAAALPEVLGGFAHAAELMEQAAGSLNLAVEHARAYTTHL